MHKKIRFRLEPGVPLYFVSAIQKRQPVPSLELVEFKVEGHTVTWCVRTHDNRHVEGRFKGERPIRLFDEKDWIALAIPAKFHLAANGAAPDFIAYIPGHVNISKTPDGLTPIALRGN